MPIYVFFETFRKLKGIELKDTDGKSIFNGMIHNLRFWNWLRSDVFWKK